MVYRLFVEKKPGLDHEARALLSDIRAFLGVTALQGLRILNRYDVENVDAALFETARRTVFSEPQLDNTFDTLPAHDGPVFAVEPLPGQFDQRSDSAAQCIQLISCGEKPAVRAAKVYLLSGDLTADDLTAIEKYVVNPVESRLAAMGKPETLAMQ